MIKMRSNSVSKMAKPPPPVPPRPSKSLVAEALAKTRRKSPEMIVKATPVRAAPPPPIVNINNKQSELTKSQSAAGVDIILKNQVPYERSISDEIKVNSRTIVFQSSNIKKNSFNRKDSDASSKNVEVRRVPSFNSNRDQPLLTQRKLHKVESFSKNNVINENGVIKINNTFNSFDSKIQKSPQDDNSTNGEVTAISLKKSSSFRSFTSESRENHSTKGEVNLQKSGSFKNMTIENKAQEVAKALGNENGIVETKEKVINNDQNDFDKDTKLVDVESSKANAIDNKWNEMLNDRNHVNTLIDEMFASVLEVSEQTNPINKNDIVISTETNKITISNTNSSVTSSDSGSVVSLKSGNSATVLVLNGTNAVHDGDGKMKDNISTSTDDECKSNTSTGQRKTVKFDDKMNHELLISELQDMKKEQDRILKRQRAPSMNLYEKCDSGDVPKIQHSDWVEVNDGEEVKLSSCQITIEDLKNKENTNLTLDYERISTMSSLHGLPPLPKSLSGFSLLENHGVNPPTPVRTSSTRSSSVSSTGHLVYPPHPKQHPVNGADSINIINSAGRKSTNLDTQLAILRREMYSLRQLDLSLLSQLWSLNESIQDFRQILQDQEDRILSPPSPSPTPSSADEGDTDEFYMSTSSVNFRPIAPPIPVRRPSGSSNASSLG